MRYFRGINQYLILWPRAVRFARPNYFVDFNAPRENCARVKLVMQGCCYFRVVIRYICRVERYFDFHRKIVTFCHGRWIKQILDSVSMKILEKRKTESARAQSIYERARTRYYSALKYALARKICKLKSFHHRIGECEIGREIFFTREQTIFSLSLSPSPPYGCIRQQRHSSTARDYRLHMR